jgi:hypothetical protein
MNTFNKFCLESSECKVALNHLTPSSLLLNNRANDEDYTSSGNSIHNSSLQTDNSREIEYLLNTVFNQ